MSLSIPALFAVVQITNGFFFAERPFEFTRPLHPEASGILCGKATAWDDSKTATKDAVSYTYGIGASFNNRLQIRHKAFSDALLRHENLMWLAEVAGERSAVWQSVLNRYRHVDWIDAALAADNMDYLVRPAGGEVSFETKKYIRTPAYFSDHKSTIDLLGVADASTNFYSSVETLTPALDDPLPAQDFEEWTAIDILRDVFGYGRMKESIAQKPSYGSVFSNACFNVAADNLSDVREGSVLVPISEFADLSYKDGNFVIVNGTEQYHTCDTYFWRGYVTGPYTPPTNTFLTASRYALPPDDPDFDPDNHIVFTTYAYPGAPYVAGRFEPYHSISNETVVIRECTPENPVSYRDCPYQVSVKEERWSAWGWTEEYGYFLGLQQGGNILVYTNKTVETREYSPGQRPFKFRIPTFHPQDAFTNGPPLDVKTVCAMPVPAVDPSTGEQYLNMYFRTNSYQLVLCRAFGTDGMVKKRVQDDAVSFVSLVVDVDYEFSLYFLGWKDYKPDGSDTHTYVPYTRKRMLLEIEVPFDDESFAEGREYLLKSTNIIAAVKSRLVDFVFSTYNANFDEENAVKPPPFEVAGPGLWALKYKATRELFLNFAINDIFVTCGVEFSQGVNKSMPFHVPGYRHLKFPKFPGEGWIGPFDMRPGHGGSVVIDRFKSAYQSLISAQPNVPISVIHDLYLYELLMQPYYPFMWERNSIAPTHMDVVPDADWPQPIDGAEDGK